jgi:hypothetical protein
VTADDRDRAIEERLDRYRRAMRSQHAVPVMCIGVGQDHNKDRLVLETFDGLPVEQVRDFLKAAYELVSAQCR